MFRVAVLAGVWAAGLALALGGAAAADAPAEDLTKLQGNWKPLQVEFQGVPQMPAELMKQVTVVYDKSEYHLYFVHQANGEKTARRLAQATITLEAAAPGALPGIVFEFAEGPLKGTRRHGVYELAGNQLKVCYGPADRPRPTEFKAPAGSGLFLETWARQAR